MSLAFSLLIALAMGLCVARLLLPHSWNGAGGLPLLLCLSLGLGLGVSSLWFFLWLVIFGPHRSAFIAGEIGILVVLALLLLVVHQRSKPLLPGPAAAQLSWLWCIPGAAFLAALLTAVVAFTRYSAAGPHGAWDAWGAWNLRARFLYLGGTHWTGVFSARGTMPHRDYPLLLSATVARCWTYLRSDAQTAPMVIASLFTFATAGELFCALSLLRSRSQGLIAATILLTTPFFLVLGAAQYADVPLAFFFLSTMVLLCLHECYDSAKGGELALAGTMAGLAVWTKNEGGLFLLCLLVSYFLIRRLGAHAPELGFFAAGLLPVLAVVAFFKICFAWHTDLLAAHGVLHRLGDPARYRIVLRSFADALLHFGDWQLSIPLLLVVYLLLLGVRKQEVHPAARIGIATLALTTLGYFFFYVTTPLPLPWLLQTSLTRLFIQLYPSALFLLFLVARTPEEALNQASP